MFCDSYEIQFPKRDWLESHVRSIQFCTKKITESKIKVLEILKYYHRCKILKKIKSVKTVQIFVKTIQIIVCTNNI